MTLSQVCEPFFQFVCSLNRAKRKGITLEPSHVHAQFEQELRDVRERAGEGTDRATMLRQVELIERPLIYFFDSLMVRQFFGDRWDELSVQRNWLGYEEHFYRLLDDTLDERGEDATERLGVFYTCLGLGFEGFFEGQPEKISSYMDTMARRLRDLDLIDAGLDAKLCREAYEHTDSGDELVKPVGGQIGAVGLVIVGLIVLLVVLMFVGYNRGAHQLAQVLQDIQVAVGGGT